MASDNLRREVAQKLRELEVGDFPDGRFYDWGDVETALGIVDYGSWYKEADVQRLADLIDRPTCRFEPAYEPDMMGKVSLVECSKCGWTVEPWNAVDFRFCPNCGAKREYGNEGLHQRPGLGHDGQQRGCSVQGRARRELSD